MRNLIGKLILLTAIVLAILTSLVGQAQKPELIVQNGHLDSVFSVAFSPDGKILASGSGDKTVKLWNVSTGTELGTLKGHSFSIVSVAFSPDGKILASGSGDKTVKLWNVSTGTELRTLTGHSGVVHSVAFSPDGQTLASGNEDFTVKLWDVSTGTELRTLKGHSFWVNSVAFSPDGKTLASGSEDETVNLWDVSTGTELRTLKAPSSPIASVAFSPDAKTLASGSRDSAVKLWDVSTGKELRTITGHSGAVNSVAFSPDGKTLASGSYDQTIKLWDVSTGTELRTLKGHSDSVYSVEFSPDGKFLVSSGLDKTIRLSDITTTKLVRTFPADTFDNNTEGAADWLVVTPEGLFDGSPSAWNKILWHYGQNTFDLAPVEAFFNDYYHPGLLAEVVSGKKPRSAPSIATLDRRQPLVKLSADESGSARNVRIRVEVAEAGPDKDQSLGSGVRDARLFRNGSRVAAWRGDLVLKDGKAVLEATVPIVAGQNTFTAYAFNRDNIRSSETSITLAGNESLRRVGTTYILAIGIDQYSNPAFSLKYAVSDAQVFSQELALQQAKLDVPRQVQKFFLSNGEATKSSILQAIERISEQALPEDLVILYFSGHGSANQEHYYLIPHDLGYDGARDKLDASILQLILSHSISDQDLAQSLEKIDCEHLVLIIDSTKSGQLLRTKGMSQLAYEKRMFILTSSQSDQESFESAKINHGFLTYALIEEGLRGGRAAASDGTVTLRRWLQYATERVPEIRGASSQIPFLFLPRENEEGPFIVAKIDKGRGNVSR